VKITGHDRASGRCRLYPACPPSAAAAAVFERLVDLDLKSVGQRVGLVGHTDNGYQLGEHFAVHALRPRGRRMGVDAVGAAVGDADCNIDQFLGQRVQGAGSHHLLHAVPGALQQLGLNRRRFPEVVDPVRLARLHDVVIQVAYFGACLLLFDEFDGRHEKPPALGYSYCALVSLSLTAQG
jgi:hypothetical protein